MKKLKTLIIAVCFLVTGCGEKSYSTLDDGKSYCLNAMASCQQTKETHSLEILASVEHVIPENPFTVLLSFSDIDQVQNVTGYLEGVSMYMGKIPLLFEADKNNEMYFSNAFVGSCSDPTMHWRIVIDVQYVDEAGQVSKIQFVDNFYSQR